MKTPEQFLIDHSPIKAWGYHPSWIIPAMKEYAKQWVEEAAMLASSQTDLGGDVVNTMMNLLKEIDAQ